MTSKTYTINKGINRPMQFKGLKAQYIFHLVVCITVLFFLTILLLGIGVNSWLCILGSIALGGFMVGRIYKINNAYGQYGLMKRSARRAVPKVILVRSRKIFINLKVNSCKHM